MGNRTDQEVIDAYAKGFQNGEAKGRKEIENDQSKIKVKILNYCLTSRPEQMWAATIMAMLLDCNFREAAPKARAFTEEFGEPVQAESMSVYRRLKVQGVDVDPPGGKDGQ